jgi:hypothetical protein
LLSEADYTSKELWQYVKPLVRQIESGLDGVLILDDPIEEKAYSKENDLISWHFDHSLKRSVKGVNQVTGMLYSAIHETSIPIGFEWVLKTQTVVDKKTGQAKRQSEETKNEHFRKIVQQAVTNNIQFKYVLADSWYGNQANMRLIKETAKKDFVLGLKSNTYVCTKIVLGEKESYQALGSLSFEAGEVKAVFFKGLDFPVGITKAIFKDEKGKDHILYLGTSDLSLTAEQIIAIYQKRWKIEVYHKSMKSNLCFAKSPTHRVRTQTNHFFFCMLAFVKMERMKLKVKSNHFALKEKIYQSGLKKAFEQLQIIKKNILFDAA